MSLPTYADAIGATELLRGTEPEKVADEAFVGAVRAVAASGHLRPGLRFGLEAAEVGAVCQSCARTRFSGATFANGPEICDACADDEAEAAADPDFDGFLCRADEDMAAGEADDLEARAVLSDGEV